MSEEPDKKPEDKYSFKIDVDMYKNLSKTLKSLWKEIGSSAQYVSFPMTNMFSYTGEVKAPLYMGNNQYGDGIYKTIFDPFKYEYINHLQKHAGYFVSQPSYYKGMFDILN